MSASDDQARPIFFAALDRTPEEWPRFLDESCDPDAELRARVEQLLHAHVALGSIPGSAGGAAGPSAVAGTVLGPYTLREPLGDGGMGSVWLAEQSVPV